MRRHWTPTKADNERQVMCLTSDEGHVWIHYMDRFPPAVRKRLADAQFNICPACLWLEVRGNRTVAAYFKLIEQIEDTLRREPPAKRRTK